MSNIQVSHSTSTNNARSESSVVANPNNPNQLVGGSKKFTDPNNYLFTLIAYHSSDAGHTWAESAALPLLAGWSGISDPALAWDDQNNCYLAALPYGPPGLTIIGIAIYKSTDGGATWSNPKLIHTSAGDDKQWAIGDPNSGTVYVAWDDGVLRFARTTDHGATWKGTLASPAAGAQLAPGSFSPEMAINSSGDLYVFWSSGNVVNFVKSTDGGDTFSGTQAAVTGITLLSGALPTTDGWPHFPGGTFRVLTLVTCCVGRNDEIMVAWADARETDGLGNHVSRIYYRRSIDGGATWLGSASGDPLLFNNASVPKTLNHFHPQIINRPNSDQVGCTFYEFGPKPVQYLIDTMIAYSTNNGGSFGSAIVVTDQPWNPAIDAPLSHGDPNVTFIGDYFGLDASNVGFYPFWTDTRTGIQEIFTDIANPIVKLHVKEFKDIKDAIKEHKEYAADKHYIKERVPDKVFVPEKSHLKEIKEKDKDKDVYEDLGDKISVENILPFERGVDERLRTLEGRIRELERGIRKGDLFIKPEERPDVASKVVKESNRQTRDKKKR